MPYIEDRIDPGQFGGLKGHSTAHYLIQLFDFILSSTDSSNFPRAVLVALIDFSKAFNRINHAKVITRLSDWGVPGWLFRILMSYLTGRSMILRYKGVQSSRHWMPGGSPQGTLLGVLLYLVYVSDIGMDLPLVAPVVPGEVDLPSVPFPPQPVVAGNEARLKYVYDLSMAECLRLDTELKLRSNSGEKYLPHYMLQKRLEEIATSAEYHDMQLNLSKSNGTLLEVVKETKLLGLTISSSCTWDANTREIVAKGKSRLWFLRRLKFLGASSDTLIDIYKLFCRSVLEYGAPVWSGNLKKSNNKDIERVQKNAYKIIFGTTFVSYEYCLETNEAETLERRRDKLCLNFAEACLKNDKFSKWFPKGVVTRNKTSYQEPEAKTKRYKKSAIPHLVRLLNSRI